MKVDLMATARRLPVGGKVNERPLAAHSDLSQIRGKKNTVRHLIVTEEPSVSSGIQADGVITLL